MQYDRRAGTIIFAILLTVALLNTIYITPLAISDSDFSTYIVVPLIMLPLFALFMLKEKMVPQISRNDIWIGIGFFFILVLATIALRADLSYLFLSMRVEMLLFPLLIAAFAALLFGFTNINKFKAIIVYAIFASPVLLIWLGSFNSAFVAGNTLLIYGFVSHIFPNVAYSAPITITANGYSVGIGSTCIGIGILIGTIMFLAPLAYLYDGKVKRKALWVASGFGLVLLLNVLRMLGIAIAWFVYGPNNATLTVHLFAGVLLFYISIIVMVLLSGKFGLSFPARKKGVVKARRVSPGFYKAGIALAVLLTIIYYLMEIGYPAALVISPVTLYNHVPFNSMQVASQLSSTINQSNFREVAFQNPQQTEIEIEATNATYTANAPVGILITGGNISETATLIGNSTVLGKRTFLDRLGLVSTVYFLNYKGNSLLFYTETMSFVLPDGSSTVASIYGVVPENVTPAGITCNSDYEVLYSAAINAFSAGAYNSTANKKITGAYCIVQSLVRS